MSHFVNFEYSRLLVADDDPILREFAAVHLATPRVTVEVAEDGEVAWQRLKKSDAGTIDIVLVDLEMPRMDGFELMGLIRADPELKHMPIVVVTGREDMMAVDRAYADGATSFVVKPINWRLLSHHLSYVLRQSREADAVRRTLLALQNTNRAKTEVLTLAQKTLKPRADLIAQHLGNLGDMGGHPVPETSLEEIRKACADITRLERQLNAAAEALEAARLSV